MTTETLTFEFDTPNGYLEDVPVRFIVNYESGINEPYSWGASRGFYDEATYCTLESVRLGQATMLREQLEQWIGTEAIAAMEARAREIFNDDMEAA